MRALSRYGLCHVVTIVCLTTAGASGLPDPPACPERVGHWGDGPAQAVAFTADATLVGSGRVLGLVGDTASPGQRPFRSEIHFAHGIQDITVAGNLAYVAAGAAGLGIVDVSSLPELSLVSQLATPGWAGGVVVDGDTAYVTYAWADDGEGGLLVVDVSAPAQPVLVSRLDVDGPSGGVALAGQHVLVVAEHHGVWGPFRRLHVIDVADPATPHEVGLLTDGGDMAIHWPIGLQVLGQYALLPGQDLLLVIDMNEPTSPELVAAADVALGGQRVALAGELVAVAGGGGVSLIDMSSPLAPVGLGSWSYGGIPHWNVALTGETMAVVAHDPSQQLNLLFELDITEPTSLEPMNTWTWPSYRGGRLAVTGSTALLAGDDGLIVLDLSQPDRPKQVSRWRTQDAVRAVAVAGKMAVVSTATGWLHLVDVCDPGSPRQVWSRPTGVRAYDIDAAGGLAVLTDASGLHVVELGPASDAVKPAFLPLAGEHRVALSPPLAFVLRGTRLDIVSLAVPRRPYQVASFFLPDTTTDVSAHADIVLVATRETAVHVIDVSDPARPVELAVAPLGPQGNRGLLATSWPLTTLCTDTRCTVLDLTDPTEPRPIGFYPLPLPVWAVAADGNRVVLSEWSSTPYAGGWPEGLTVLSTAPCLAADSGLVAR